MVKGYALREITFSKANNYSLTLSLNLVEYKQLCFALLRQPISNILGNQSPIFVINSNKGTKSLLGGGPYWVVVKLETIEKYSPYGSHIVEGIGISSP